MDTERNCQFCEYYKDGYCENLELKPCYPQKGCDDFKNKDLDVLDKMRAEIASKIKRKPGLNFTLRERERNDAFLEVLDIIDKYKRESVDKESIEKESIPYLMHKEMDVPISECQKAYDVAIGYLRSQGKVKG